MRPRFLQRIDEKHIRCDVTSRDHTPVEFVYHEHKPALWPIIALVVAILLFCVVFASAAERGKPFIPPKPSLELKIIVEPGPVSASAACPMDASVLIDVADGPNHFCGSGTCIESTNGVCRILTNAHIWAGVKEPDIRITHGKDSFKASVIHANKWNDIAVLQVEADLPCVPVADSPPVIGDVVSSVGSTFNGGGLVEKFHRISFDDDRLQTPRAIQSDGDLQWSGRSGGGLFHNGQLCGTVVGFRKDARESLYTSLHSIHRHLAQCENGTPIPKSNKRWVWVFTAEEKHGKGWCKQCTADKAKFGTGNADLELVWLEQEVGVRGPELYPAYRFLNGDGDLTYPTIKKPLPNGQHELVYYHPKSLEELKGFLDRAGTEPEYLEPVSSSAPAPVGASIHGRAVIQQILAILDQFAGPDAEFSFRMIRKGGLEAFPMGKMPTRTELFGTSGRIEIVCKSAKLPVHELKFDYRFEAGRVFFRFDEIECEIPEDGTVGSAEPVGSVILTAWTVFSVIQTVYSLLTPTMDLWVPNDLQATATLKDGRLNIQSGTEAVAVRLHWSFWWGLLKFEYQRAIDSLEIVTEEVTAHFRNVRRFRDVRLEVVE